MGVDEARTFLDPPTSQSSVSLDIIYNAICDIEAQVNDRILII